MDEDESGAVAVVDDDAGDPVRIEVALAAIATQLRQADERAAARERIIDRLHDENQRLRAGERQLVLRPLLVDLQRLHAELLRAAGHAQAGFAAEQAADLLLSFARSAEQALERGGVTVLRPVAGAAFDPALHRASEVVVAPSAAHDSTVASVIGDGYYDGVQGRAITPATVRVYRWTSPSTPVAAPAGSPATDADQPFVPEENDK